MSRNTDAVQDAVNAMQDVEQAACGKADGTCCPFFDGCANQQQKAPAIAPDTLLLAHAGMLRRLLSGIGRDFALVVADEG
jgi:hypothetical protein